MFNKCGYVSRDNSPINRKKKKNLKCSKVSLKYRSNHRRCFVKKGDLKNFANFTGKHQCWSLFLDCNFIKKRLQHRCFPMKFAKFLRIPILKNICERLLLKISNYQVFCMVALRYFMYTISGIAL